MAKIIYNCDSRLWEIIERGCTSYHRHFESPGEAYHFAIQNNILLDEQPLEA